jgi:hypothetical protein
MIGIKDTLIPVVDCGGEKEWAGPISTWTGIVSCSVLIADHCQSRAKTSNDLSKHALGSFTLGKNKTSSSSIL